MDKTRKNTGATRTNENKIGGFLNQQTQKFLNKILNFTSAQVEVPDRLFLCVKFDRIVIPVRFFSQSSEPF
jgi:hypothetical protein